MDEAHGFSHNLLRNIIMYVAIILLFALETAALPTVLPAHIQLSIIPAIIFFVTLFNPVILPYLLIFGLGLLTDFMSEAPAGLHALYYCLISMLAQWQHRYLSGQTFFVSWLAYGVILLAGHFILWLGYSLYHFQLMSTHYILLGSLYGFFVFPFIAFLFHTMLRYEPAEEGL